MAVSTQEYARLLKVPYAISREIDRFEKNRSAIKKDYENEKKNIQECRIIDIPEGMEEEAHQDVETLSLFDDEEES